MKELFKSNKALNLALMAGTLIVCIGNMIIDNEKEKMLDGKIREIVRDELNNDDE